MDRQQTRHSLVGISVSLTLGVGLIAGLLWLVNESRADGISASILHAAGSARSSAGAGDVYCVTSEGGGPYPGCDLVFTNVQDAVDAASGGEIIKVASGLYAGVQSRPAPSEYWLGTTSTVTQAVYISKEVTIQGGYTTVFTDPPTPAINPTTLDAQGDGRVIFIVGDITPTISGLHITGGKAEGMGGGSGYSDAGGGVYVINAAAIISNNLIFSNTAAFGGGLYLLDSSAILIANTVSSNTVSGSEEACGGGLDSSFSDATLIENTITDNRSTGHGGGLCLEYSQGTMLSNNTVSNNSAGRCGGLFVMGEATLNGNVIVGNVASGGGGGLCLRLESGNSTLNGNIISGNTAGFSGGGVTIEGDATLNGNTISNNTANWGGGLYLDGGNVAFSGNIISNNTAYYNGGGLYLGGSPSTLTNTMVVGNRAMAKGSGIYITSSKPRLLHATIANNSGGGSDGVGVYITDNGESWYANVTLTNTIFVGHAVGIYVNSGNTALLESTLWSGNTNNWAGGGTIAHANDHTGNPSFVTPDSGDYHTGPGSAALDVGVDAGVYEDIDGHPRPLESGFDLGADEYTGVYLYPSRKSASPDEAGVGDVVTFTIVLYNGGTDSAIDTVLFDAIPAATTYVPSSAWASSGVVTDTDGISWTGTVTPDQVVTITFQVTVDEATFIENTAIVTDRYGTVLNLVTWVNPRRIYLPLILRSFYPDERSKK